LPETPTAETAEPKADIFISRNNQTHGPYPRHVIESWINTRKINRYDLACTNETPWQPVTKLLWPQKIAPSPKTSIGTVPLIVAGIFALAALGLVIAQFDDRQKSSNTQFVSNATPSPLPTQADDSEADFSSERSREILAAFFIKPVLKQTLNDPDSLQDLIILNVTPTKTPGVYKAIVSYRARNGFGALVAQRQTFMVTRGVGKGLDAWRVTPTGT
jgi:hypothetical protein